MPTPIRPRKLPGPWLAGFALDFHTSSSVFLGYNAFGHPEFETKRTPVGDLLYRLKNRGDMTAVEPLAEAASELIQARGWHVDALVPMPPSNTARKRQPVMEVARAICRRTGLRLCVDCVSKVKSTGQLKDVFDRARREEILAGAFSVNTPRTRGQRLLVLDDLFRSGATATALVQTLLDDGAAAQVCLLALTQTRKNL